MNASSPFETLLAQRIGLDPASIGPAAIDHAVQQRAARAAHGDLARYLDLLNRSPDERQALIEQVVVPETWFFRYPESWALLGERVADMVRCRNASGDRTPVRIISLPCSTGEEPYSIVMALRDRGVERSRYVVHALDVSQQVVARAREARYGKNAFRTEDLGFRTRYFTEEKGSFVLQDAIRDSVEFRAENLFDLSPDTCAARYDIVFCRNLLIYFDPATQRRALAVLASLCDQAGELFVGPAEASLLTRAGHVPVATHRAFAFRNKARTDATRVAALQDEAEAAGRVRQFEPAATPALFSAMPVRPSPSRQSEKKSVPFTTSAMAAAMSAPAAPPATQPRPADPAAYTSILALADQGHVDRAIAAAQAVLVQRGPDADLFYLLGLCHDARAETDAAAKFYRKAVYLMPTHVPALNHLAAALDAQGDDAGAQRMRMRALREEARRE